MLTALFSFLVLLQCGLSLPRGDDLRLGRLVTEDAEARRQCLEDGDYCWDPEECCTGAMIGTLSYQNIRSYLIMKESAATTGLQPPPLCLGSAARSLSVR